MLSLDPTSRLESAFRAGDRSPVVVKTPQTPPDRTRPTIFKLTGDLDTRAGLFLTWDDVRRARSDHDKAYLLREAARIAKEGMIVVLAPNPGPASACLWTSLLAPALRDAAHSLIAGPPGYAWPAPLVALPPDLGPQTLLSHLQDVTIFTPPIHIRPGEGQLAYSDLQIRIRGPVGTDNTYPVEADLDTGEHFANGALRLDGTALQEAGNDPARYGALLFDALFLGLSPIQAAYEKAQASAEARTAGRLRVRLWIEAEAGHLHALHWERLHYPGDRHLPLATAAHLPFSRYIDLPSAEASPLVQRPLRMLVAISNPQDLADYTLPSLDVDADVAQVLDAVRDIPSGKVQLDVLPGRSGLSEDTRARVKAMGHRLCEGATTLPRVLQRLSQTPYAVLHIVAHGRFRRQQKTAALCLENAQGQAQWIDDTTLISRLKQVDTLPHLLFLAACESAARPSDDNNPFVGLAPHMVRAGVPAVVAMQDKIDMPVAQMLTRGFYGYVFGHGIADRALNQARLLLYDAQYPGGNAGAVYALAAGQALCHKAIVFLRVSCDAASCAVSLTRAPLPLPPGR